MKSNSRVYVIGHKNPDTDSICSAIAYADIKNRTDKTKTYVARRAGQINEETEYVLKRFGVRAPGYLPKAGTQVKEIEIHEVPSVPRRRTICRVSLPSAISRNPTWIRMTAMSCPLREHSTAV